MFCTPANAQLLPFARAGKPERARPRSLAWSVPELALGRLRTSEQAVRQAMRRIVPRRIWNAGVQAGLLFIAGAGESRCSHPMKLLPTGRTVREPSLTERVCRRRGQGPSRQIDFLKGWKMNVPRALICALLPAVLWTSAQAASISWIGGTTPPAQWTLSPANPGPSSIIQFTGPTGVYSNSCMAQGDLGGTPQLSIDPVAKVILIWFQGPAPEVCPKIYMPVCGLEGEFGPLASDTHPDIRRPRDPSS